VKQFYAIGDVARRTGLRVSAIRFYAGVGIVAPTEQTDGGFRRYDVHAIARLEVVRTLRELAAHLALVEGQLRQLTARRAVLLRQAQVAGRDSLRQYQSMMATINGTPEPDQAAATHEWIAAALRQGGDGGTV
jgi:DNA-binding transcriptional MerR regulator